MSACGVRSLSTCIRRGSRAPVARTGAKKVTGSALPSTVIRKPIGHRHQRQMPAKPAELATNVTLQAGRYVGCFASSGARGLPCRRPCSRLAVASRLTIVLCPLAAPPADSGTASETTAAPVHALLIPRPGADVVSTGTGATAGQGQMTTVKREPAVQPGLQRRAGPRQAEGGERRALSAELAAGGKPSGRTATVISARTPVSPTVARRPPPGGCILTGSRGGG